MSRRSPGAVGLRRVRFAGAPGILWLAVAPGVAAQRPISTEAVRTSTGAPVTERAPMEVAATGVSVTPAFVSATVATFDAAPAWSWREHRNGAERFPTSRDRGNGSAASARVPQSEPMAPVLAAAWSAFAPGSGQLLLGRRRGWIFLALETMGWVAYLDRRSAGADARERYRDFAWSVARQPSEARVDGDWPYYETLIHWTRSGGFDVDRGAPGVQPETDATTYNGWVWTLATGLHGADPDAGPADARWRSALAYYEEEAYGSAFLWDWSGTGAAHAEYTRMISESDRLFRDATNVAGLIIANHVVASVEAFLTSRGARSARASLVPRVGPGGVRWSGAVSLSVGR